MSRESRLRAIPTRVVSTARRRLTHLGTYRTDLRRRGRRLATDALVVLLLLGVLGVVVAAAGYAVVFAVNAGGTPGVVLGWTGAFAFAVSLPVVAMKLSTALYSRLGA